MAAPAAPPGRGKEFVDLQNDVTVGDVALAAHENYRSVEHLKRYTTTGMGTDQGKTSNVNALVLMGRFTGRAPAEVGTTKFRPPFAPVTLGTLAGRRVGELYRPLKTLPAHEWHAAQGALFETFGNWSRPAAYPRAGESLEAAAQREALAVRERAGLFDGSPLGKLEMFGPDAAHFLDLMYVGTMSSLKPGQARYGLLLNENGIVVDDGIVARLGPERFWVNTTTAGVERTQAAFEEWLQCEYTDFEVLVTPVTSRWGNVTVAGPRALAWLERIGLDAAHAPRAFPHMTLREISLEGVPLRVLRASFSGEVGYEINVPALKATWLLSGCGARAPRPKARSTASRRWRYCAWRRAISTSAPTPTARRCRRMSASRAASTKRAPTSSAAARSHAPPGAIRSACSWSAWSPSMAAPCCRSAGRSPARRPRPSPKVTSLRAVSARPLNVRSRWRCSGAAGSAPARPSRSITWAGASAPGWWSSRSSIRRGSGSMAEALLQGGGLSVREHAGVCCAALRYFGREGAFAAALAAQEMSLPEPGRLATGPDLLTLWRTPTETLALARTPQALERLEQAVAAVRDGCYIELTGALNLLEISGRGTDELTARLGGANTHPQPGEARRVRLADVPVLAFATAAEDLGLLIDRGLAPHLLGWIRETLLDMP